MLCPSLYPAQDNLVGHNCRVCSFLGMESCALGAMMLLLLMMVPFLSIIICSKYS